ncbi:glycosyltransferase [candidate division KSB1 bacterium]|nr:glycosyltransferase [candidate division KSB1 bacterium]RQW08553.1 MAG: glycosyltransferase [candidate division KSB1 bacterium]
MLNVSVCVVVYNAIEHIQECLDSLMALDYPSEHCELLFVDNNSTDGTKELLQYYCEHYAHVRMVVNPIIGIAGSRNMGLKNARFDYIAFTDSDCVVPSHWLAKLVNGFEKYSREELQLAAVGGSNIPPVSKNRFYDVLDIMLDTFLGSHGSVQGRRFNKDRYVPHLPTVNVLYHKPTILRAGGFDVTFGNIGEDRDLSYRLEQLGYRLVYLTDTAVVHKLRPTWRAWLKNMYVYGKGRMWLMRKHPDKIDVMLFAPLLLLLSMALPFLSFLAPYFALPLLYFPFVFIASVVASFKRSRPGLAVPLFFLYIGTHFAYGIGQVAGILKKRDFHRNSRALVDANEERPNE